MSILSRKNDVMKNASGTGMKRSNASCKCACTEGMGDDDVLSVGDVGNAIHGVVLCVLMLSFDCNRRVSDGLGLGLKSTHRNSEYFLDRVT